jgi:hypothetical protein
MATLDEEWLGGDNKPVEERLEHEAEWIGGQPEFVGSQLYSISVMKEAAGEIRALRILVKHQSKRIDDLTKELDAIMEPDDDDR